MIRLRKWVDRNIPQLIATLLIIIFTLFCIRWANELRGYAAYGGEYVFLLFILILPWKWSDE